LDYNYEDIQKTIKAKNVGIILKIFFEGKQPLLRAGYKTETDLWDYKGFCPKPKKQNRDDWAKIARDVLAFHNNKGGILFFGISNSYSFCGVKVMIDSKLFNDQIRKYVGDKIWVQFNREFIQKDQSYLGIAIIPPRGTLISKFQISFKSIDSDLSFNKGDFAIREGDSSKIYPDNEAIKFVYQESFPQLNRLYCIDEPMYRILQPPYSTFVHRKESCDEILTALKDKRTSVCSILGLGGVGKTALASWAAIESYNNNDFQFIVSMTAKDRELTKTGIIGLDTNISSFEDLLNSIADVFEMPDIKLLKIDEREKEIRTLLEGSNGLLFIDNLETVDDPRILTFLDSLPFGCRALITSRMAKVRVSVYPIDVGPLDENEIISFINAMKLERDYQYLDKLDKNEIVEIGTACDGIPLAIRWICSQVQTKQELFSRTKSLLSVMKFREELLEFCFRRVFEALPEEDRNILKILSLFDTAVGAETFVIGGEFTTSQIEESIDSLHSSSLIRRFFDSKANDYRFSLIPLTNAFISGEVLKDKYFEQNVRKRLSNYYQAIDVRDPVERMIIRDFRLGKEGTELKLASLAKKAERTGDISSANDLFLKAIESNDSNWLVLKNYAEFCRDINKDFNTAIKYYEKAAQNAPRRGRDKAIIFRELGLLLRKSGLPNALDLAVEKLEVAVEEDPEDVYAIHALARCYDIKGHHYKVIELLAPLKNHPRDETRKRVQKLLIDAYLNVGELLKSKELRLQYENDFID